MNARTDFAPWDRDESSEVAALRVPPHSTEAEQSVLGGLLLDNSAWDRVGDMLCGGDFYRYDHGALFGVISGLIAASKPADVITVWERLQVEHPRSGIDLVYLNALAESVPSASNIRRYAEIVREKATLRALVAASDEVATAAFTGSENPADLAGRAISLFEAANLRGQLQKPRPADELAVARIDHFNDVATGEHLAAFPTGLEDLDAALNGGLQEGRVYVLAARPSIGKSSLALQVGLHQAQSGRGVLLLSQEMPAEECIDRALANIGRVDYGQMQRAQLDDTSWAGMSHACEVVGKLPLWIDDQPALTLRDIRAKAMSLRREGLKLLIVDYLQLCSGSTTGKGVNRNTELEEITRGVKAMAKQLRISVLLLSQLSREVERRGTPEPTLGDLRDSGAIEQDADAVLGLWFVRQWSDRKVMALTVLKNRQGERGQRIALEFFGQYQLWQSSQADVSPVVKKASSDRDFE